MPGDRNREPFLGRLRTMKQGVLPMKRAKCFCCVNWRNVILYCLLSVLAVVLLCLLPRWVLCFLVIVLGCICGALLVLRQ